MRCELECEIRIERFAVFAELAVMARRPELGLLCRAVRDRGRRFTGAAVSEVLPGLQARAAENLVAWCRQLGLCDEHDGLTRLGEEVAERDEAPLPELGVYDLFCAAHGLLGARILHAERLTSTRDQRFESRTPLPLHPDPGVLFQSILDQEQRIVLRDFPRNHEHEPVCLLEAVQGHCRLRWTLDFDAGTNAWQLEGTLHVRGQQRPLVHAEEHDETLAPWELFAQWAQRYLGRVGRWLEAEHRLAVRFEGLTVEAQERFCQDLELPEVEVPGRGVFREVEIEEVPLAPATAEDARRWARARFDRRLRDAAGRPPHYLPRPRVRKLYAETVEGTPLAAHAPELPDHDRLLEELAEDPALYWALAAPVDLAPAPVPPAELGPLRIG